MKHVFILGSTGSIGKSGLEVIRQNPREFKAVGLSTNSNTDMLYRQIKDFHPKFVCVREGSAARDLKSRPGLKNVKVFSGEDGLIAMLGDKCIDEVLLAISGSAALRPLLAAIDNGHDVALANKEAMVMAGPIINKAAARNKVKIIPVDSEQSAIWQCLEGEGTGNLKTIYLTASGGPLRLMPKSQMHKVSAKTVLKHPRWKMGKKITVDSATLMNKGLEVLEAIFLFAVSADKIKVLIHPEAIIHSMVEFVDGVVMAQLSVTDMRIPIQYALSYPRRLFNDLEGIDFYRLKELHFQRPDFKRFPCLRLSYQVAQDMGSAPCVLNAANEISVEGFLNNNISFTDIPRIIEKVLSRHHNILSPDLKELINVDSWAREEARRVIGNLN